MILLQPWHTFLRTTFVRVWCYFGCHLQLILIFFTSFCIGFVNWFMASFLYCSFCSYHYSSNYCTSNSYRFFSLLRWKRRVRVILSLSPIRARKSDSDKITFTLCYCLYWQEIKIVGTAINLLEAKEKRKTK